LLAGGIDNFGIFLGGLLFGCFFLSQSTLSIVWMEMSVRPYHRHDTG
jgi:hypothetical protein